MTTTTKLIIGVPIMILGFSLTLPPIDYIMVFVGSFLYGSAFFDFVDTKKVDKKLYSHRDLERAFNDGRLYGEQELELLDRAPENVTDTAYNRWFHHNFLENQN